MVFPDGSVPVGTSEEQQVMGGGRRNDKVIGGNVVYACFVLMGLGTLLPWNFFITAQSYWDYKFREVAPDNGTSQGAPGMERTFLQNLYVPMQVCFSQIPNFVFLFINMLFSHKVPLRVRLLASLTLMILLFAVTTALTQVNTDSWQTGFFAITIIVIFFINSSGAIFQGGLFGVAGMFPERGFFCVFGARAIGRRVFASAARIVSLSVGAADATSAFIYFMVAVAVMILTMCGYLYMSKTDFYKYYSNPQESVESNTDQTEKLSKGPEKEENGGTLSSHLEIMKEIWPMALSVTGVFFVTLAAFPVLCVKIISTSSNENWRNVYFQPVSTFLLFNVGDYVGRLSAGLILWPRKGSWILYLMVLGRLVFIPLFLLCNHDPKSNIPSVFTHDAWYIVIMLLFSLSNGYCSSLAMTYGPKLVSESKAEKASSMMAAMLGLGLLMGGVSSFGFGLIS
ncbi:equilibrative nucleoside transporter 1-like [Macrobrachium nipponense]|uniref:equilibrative nucleoside transporter 1-like n=1 Tax=Macrobrachium nipponense TaxID=159736 RepID=UPI0030C8A34C